MHNMFSGNQEEVKPFSLFRSHFTKEKKSSPLELSVSDGDIFHVTDTLFGGTVGLWQAARVYSANANKGEPPKGVIPNQVSPFFFRNLLSAFLV